jgi:hypothetical protein
MLYDSNKKKYKMNKGEDFLSTCLGGICLIFFIIFLFGLIAAYPILGLIPIGLLALAIWVLPFKDPPDF